MSLLLFILILAGAAAWWLSFRPTIEPEPNSLDALPRNLAGWRSVDLEIDQAVAEMLNADHNVQRAYSHPLGYITFVYVGYYGTERGGIPEHTPDVCYPSQGWRILTSGERRIGGNAGFDIRELVVQKEQTQRLVHYWYQTSSKSGVTSVWALRIRHFWSRLTTNRGDGALIRLSTPMRNAEIYSARERLIALDLKVREELDEVWPAQAPQPQASTKPETMN